MYRVANSLPVGAVRQNTEIVPSFGGISYGNFKKPAASNYAMYREGYNRGAGIEGWTPQYMLGRTKLASPYGVL